MPIEVGLWKLGDRLKAIQYSRIAREKQLESLLAADVSVIDSDLMLIGRQVVTGSGGFIDLLALDVTGQIVVIELKRDRTPREVVAQILDYASWASTLTEVQISNIFTDFQQRHTPGRPPRSLSETFQNHFSVSELPEPLNETHRLILVASELDDSSERIINYLAEHGISINAAFFRVFRDGDSEFLIRAWLADPDQVEARVEAKRERLPWNGEFYVSFGANQNRNWDEARKYGFISAGHGVWYTRTLSSLEPGSRIWVNIPGSDGGYVGVGIVKESVVPIDEFTVKTESGNVVPILSLPLNICRQPTMASDPDKAEHLVRVEWLHTVHQSQAMRETGFFGNQNSVAKPRDQKWTFTVERLKQHFGITE
jgi:hypothetical protein